MVAQRDEAEGEGAAPNSVGIAVPMKVVIVDDGSVERRTVSNRKDDDWRRFYYRARSDLFPGKHSSAAVRI